MSYRRLMYCGDYSVLFRKLHFLFLETINWLNSMTPFSYFLYLDFFAFIIVHHSETARTARTLKPM